MEPNRDWEIKEDGIGTVGSEMFLNIKQGTIQIFSFTF
jgi:hypothetical protein